LAPPEWNDSKQILEALERFADVIRNSRLHQSYHKSRVQLERQPETSAKLRAFKQREALSQNPGFDEEKALSHHYAELTQNAAAAAFLEREKVLLETYVQIIELLDTTWDMDTFDAGSAQGEPG
jgi:hypothetical protein